MRHKVGWLTLVFISLWWWCGGVMANVPQATVVGQWQTIDNQTKKPSSIIAIWRAPSGQYFGKVHKTYQENGHRKTDLCTQCRGSQHNHPMLGLVIIRDMVTKDKIHFSGGTIMDPRDGKTYRCKLTVSKSGNKLFVRGYIGLPWLGKTTTWYRYRAKT